LDENELNAPAETKVFKKTPLFQAFHAARYQRQALIQQINRATGTKLVCYVAGLAAPIDRDDPAAFADLLFNLEANGDVDLLLHSGGGDIDAAEKLIRMLRQKVGTGRLRVVVPDFAKSAGTLMALGADVIIMGDTSELGPIDPQIVRIDKDGNRVQQSVQNYLDAFDDHKAALEANPNDIVAQLLISKIDPATLKHYSNVRLRARTIAERLLKAGMFKEKGNWSAAATTLIDTKQWPSHAQMISWQDATSVIGLNVEYREPDDGIWEMYWQLYCLQKLAIEENQKLFESDYASLSIAL
jgi:hypothetical protein